MRNRSTFIRFIEWSFGSKPDRGYLVVCYALALGMAFVIVCDRYL